MKVILKGVQHSKGSFEGVEYDNYKLHCVATREMEGIKGIAVSVIKVNPSVFEEFMRGKTDEMVLDKRIDIEIASVNNKSVVQYIELIK